MNPSQHAVEYTDARGPVVKEEETHGNSLTSDQTLAYGRFISTTWRQEMLQGHRWGWCRPVMLPTPPPPLLLLLSTFCSDVTIIFRYLRWTSAGISCPTLTLHMLTLQQHQQQQQIFIQLDHGCQTLARRPNLGLQCCSSISNTVPFAHLLLFVCI